jgi:hypothetical protein
MLAWDAYTPSPDIARPDVSASDGSATDGITYGLHPLPSG